mmetsp:Transcript_37070/g.71119  ORF Transcript_37070/g.71119 Transcript_37070/m.71119 type:complete len:238 (+) Transcript_37070:506-1219(+)
MERRALEGAAAQPRGRRFARRTHRGGCARRHVRVHAHLEECSDGLQRRLSTGPGGHRQHQAGGSGLGQRRALPAHAPDRYQRRGRTCAQSAIHFRIHGTQRSVGSRIGDGEFCAQRERRGCPSKQPQLEPGSSRNQLPVGSHRRHFVVGYGRVSSSRRIRWGIDAGERGSHHRGYNPSQLLAHLRVHLHHREQGRALLPHETPHVREPSRHGRVLAVVPGQPVCGGAHGQARLCSSA